MGRRRSEWEPWRWGSMIVLLMGLVSFSMVCIFMSTVFKPPSSSPSLLSSTSSKIEDDAGSSESKGELESGGCCKGMENIELRGDAVKWGTDFKFNSSEECCKACKGMCRGNEEPCVCDSWVFCGNKEACGQKFGECWLRKQEDVLAPEKRDRGDKMWTSGLLFGRGQGIVGFETEHGTLRVKLFPECSPQSVAYILELLSLRHCSGLHFYRAESRGRSWDKKGNHIKNASFGPPYALIQGTLEANGQTFTEIESEYSPTLRRGSVAWVGSGPSFFISLGDHEEWGNAHTVFGSVVPEDMDIAEKIGELPTESDVWGNTNVRVLESKVPLKIKRINSDHDDL